MYSILKCVDENTSLIEECKNLKIELISLKGL